MATMTKPEVDISNFVEWNWKMRRALFGVLREYDMDFIVKELMVDIITEYLDSFIPSKPRGIKQCHFHRSPLPESTPDACHSFRAATTTKTKKKKNGMPTKSNMISEMILVESMNHLPVTIFGIIYEYARYRSILLLGGALRGLNYLITFSPFNNTSFQRVLPSSSSSSSSISVSISRDSRKEENDARSPGINYDNQLLSCDFDELPPSGVPARVSHALVMNDTNQILFYSLLPGQYDRRMLAEVTWSCPLP
jgi:hypothetical protein